MSQQHSLLLDSLLAAVKGHAELADDRDNNLLELRQLSIKVLDLFKKWVDERQKVRESVSSSNDGETEDDEISIVGKACLQIVQLRLHLANAARRQKRDEDVAAADDGDDAAYYSTDSTLSLVLECVDIFVGSALLSSSSSSSELICTEKTENDNQKNDDDEHEEHQQQQNSKTSKSATAVQSSSLTPWRNLVVFLCADSTCPLEISLRGFRLLVNWVLNSTLSSSSASCSSSSSFSSVASTFLKRCLTLSSPCTDTSASSASSVFLLMSRLASVLHDKFSSSKVRKFCLTSGFDQVIQRDGLLPHYCDYFRRSNDSDNNNNKSNNNRKKIQEKGSQNRDVLTVATIFTSIAHVLSCCGPKYLQEDVAKIIRRFLKSNNNNNNNNSSSGKRRQEEQDFSQEEETADDDVEFFLEKEILRPFAHQAVGEMFQRGSGDGNKDQDDEENDSANTENGWVITSFLKINYDEDEDDEDREKQQQDAAAISTSSALVDVPHSVSLITSPIMENCDELLKSVRDHDSIEQWIRAVSAIVSSSVGYFSLRSFSSASSSLLEQKFSAIVKQMLKSSASTGSLSVKIIGLNAIQSVAVPLCDDLKSLLKLIRATEKNQQQRASSSFSLKRLAAVFQQIVEQSGSLLKKILHEPLEQQQQKMNNGNNAPFSFASVIFPLGTRSARIASSNSNDEDKVGDAFWTMIEQLIVAPPFLELTRLLSQLSTSSEQQQQQEQEQIMTSSSSINNNNNNNNNNNIYSSSIVRHFIDNFVDPVLSPMMPSLVSLMSTTSQKELGRELYQRRRLLASSLLRVEQLLVNFSKTTTTTTTTATNNARDEESVNGGGGGLICGCPKIMWTKLRNSVLVAGGSLE